MPPQPPPAHCAEDQQGLDRRRLVAAALDLVRAEGPEALTMRRLADRLGCGAMSIYRHVRDRQALLRAMLDSVAQQIEVPPQEDPRAEITAILTAVHARFRADPWIVRVLIFEGTDTLDILPLIDRILGAFDRMGLDPGDAVLAYATLIQHAYGEALASAHGPTPDRLDRLRRAARSGGHTHVLRAFMEAPGSGAGRYAEQLQALIQGLTDTARR